MPQSDTDTDAIDMLTRDHQEVDELFQQYDDLAENGGSEEDRQVLAEQICLMLTVHTMLEEEIFYPAAREALEADDLLDEAEVEHASARDLIEQIQEMDPDEDLYDAKVKVLGEYVRHHVHEEEQELFPQCRQSDMDLDALGTEMAERRRELMAELEGEEEEEEE